MYHHFVHFGETVEVRDILSSVVTRQRAEHCIRRYPGTLALRGVDFYGPLRVTDIESGVSHRDFGTLVQCPQVLLCRREERTDIAALLILHMQFQRVTHTITGYHPRRDGEDAGVLYVRRHAIDLPDNRLHIFPLARAFVPRFELQDQHAERVPLSGQQTVAGDFLDVQYLRDAFQALFDASHHIVRRLQRATGRRTDIYKDDTLVFIGH